MKIIEKLKFDKDGLIPAIIQDHKSGLVLMMAYMNKESIKKTISTGKTTFWSRSRQKLWTKGEESSHYQYVKKINIDCDEDCLLIQVEQVEAACHTNNYSCFYRKYDIEKDSFTDETVNEYIKSQVLQEVYEIIEDRIENPKEGSYTNYLFKEGLDKILKKVGEESAEVIIAAKNNNKEEIIYEVADLVYHLLVLLVEQKVTLKEIYQELSKRR